METVSIIILNYNGVQFNENCINSILNQTYKDFEIVFVNNYSTDGSCEEVKKIYDKQIQQWILKIIQPGSNMGFAWWNNIWVKHSNPKSDYICLLNNDTIVPSDRLQNLINGIESNPTLGAVGSVIYDQWYEKQLDEFLFKKYKKWINNYFFESVETEQTKEDKEWSIIYTTGLSWCCLLYKKKLLDLPFDEIYFAYMEDTALCMKILLQWYRLGIVKNSIVQHFGSWSFGKKPTPFKVFHGMKNYILNFILLSQWYRRIIILPFFLLWLMTRVVFNHPLVRLQGLIKALGWIFAHTKKIMRERKYIKRTISVSQFYSQLSDKFMIVPYYTHASKRQIKLISLLNMISIAYFRLFWIFVSWREK